MDIVDKQIGPIMVWNCKGCHALNTWDGDIESHHTCPADGWKSIKQTNLGEYPNTPDTCPFIR